MFESGLRRSGLLAAAFVAAWLSSAPRPLQAAFSEPKRVTAAGHVGGGFQLGLDFFENLTIVHEEDGQLYLETRGTGLSDRMPLGPGSEPNLALSLLGSFVVYSTQAPGSGDDRKVFLRSRVGPQWSAAEQVSEGDGDDHRPAVQLGPDGVAAVVWERRSAGGPPHVWFRRGRRPAADAGRGENPAFVIDGAGRAHIFFLRDDDIFYAKESSTQPGVFAHAVNATQTPFVLESAPSVAIFERKRIFLCYESEGVVFLANDRAGDFLKPVFVADGGALNPILTLSPNGVVGITFEKDGDIQTVLGATFFLPPAQPAIVSPEPESRPTIAIDSFANVFIAFKRDGAVNYATNAGLPQASFEADRVRGEAPLTVTFADKSTGGVTGWGWDFGDGTTSQERNPVHTYTQSGEYAVRLRVSGPGGESPLAQQKLILVIDPRNQMRIADVSVFPGQGNVYVPVLATHDKPTQGFTIAATYDPTKILARSVAFEESNIDGLAPELFAVNISDDPVDPYITAGILFDVQAPFDGRVFPPGVDQRIANVIVDVSAGAAPGSTTRIQLRNQTGAPPLNNIFTVDGYTILPRLAEGGAVAVRRLRFPPPRFFLRGDTDGNRLVNLTDAILTLNYLFSGGAEPACADAADVTDDGAIDVSDATFLLGFLFKSGSYPAPPFPDMGLDATEDRLPECLLR